MAALIFVAALACLARGVAAEGVAVNAKGDITSTVDQAKSLKKTDPHAALQLLQPQLEALNASTKNNKAQHKAQIAVYEAAADAFSAVKQPARAVELRQQVLALRKKSRKTSLFELIKASVALAQDLKDDRRYGEALEVVNDAGIALEKDESKSSDKTGIADKNAMASVLMRIEASLLDCAGESLEALKVYAKAQQVAGADPMTASSPTILRHLDMLNRALASEQLAVSTSSSAAAADKTGSDKEAAATNKKLRKLFTTQAAKLKAEVLRRGPWTHPQHLPHSYIRGLEARPWHEPSQYPASAGLQQVMDLLSSKTEDLVAEYRSLKAAGLLLPEAECIHDAAKGNWHTFMVNGVWNRDKDANGCSIHTPVACGILQAAPSLPSVSGFRPLRAGYSAVGGRAHLFPHYGITNAQLKFHLGLIVPHKKADGTITSSSSGSDGGSPTVPCARIRVGNETRAWAAGRVLFFDDSWEHEVWNECDDAERVVLQLVFSHPGLAALGHGSDPFAAALEGKPAPSH